MLGLLAAPGHHVPAPAAATTGAPSALVVLLTGALATALVLLLWSVVGHVVTFAHEGGHALAAVLLGGRVTAVRLNADRTGVTESTRALVELPVTLAGYLAPSAFGVLGAVLLVRGQADMVLWVSLGLLVLLVLVTVNWFGRAAVVVTGALLVLTLQRGTPDVRVLVACVWVWLLLVGGLVHVLQHGVRGADFHALRRATWIVPAALWAALAMAASAGAVLYAGLLLVRAMPPPGS